MGGQLILNRSYGYYCYGKTVLFWLLFFLPIHTNQGVCVCGRERVGWGIRGVCVCGRERVGWGIRSDCNNTFIQLMIINLPFLSTCIRLALLCWHLSQCVASVHERIKSLNYGKKMKWYQFSSDGIDLCAWNSPHVPHPISQLFPQHLPLKQLQCLSDWWWLFLILSRKSIKHFLIPCLSPLGGQSLVWSPWLDDKI